MNFLLDNWYLVLTAAVSGGLLLWPMLRPGAGGSASVGVAEAVRLINREKGVLVDVSEPAEFAAGHAAGARSVPMAALDSGSKDLPGNKALPVVVLCPTGARAGRAAALLRKAGHERVFPLAGGTAAWREANLPIERSGA